MSDAHGWARRPAPSLDDFAELGRAAFAALPEPFRGLAGSVLLRVEDFADDALLADLGVDDPFGLSGLYEGVDIVRRSLSDPEPHNSVIFLYRRPILDEWAERGDITLGELITHVLVHEIGHHFGLSDEDIDRVEGEAG